MIDTPTGDSDQSKEPTNQQCAGWIGMISDGQRCENKATEQVSVNSYLGYGNYGVIHARVCSDCATCVTGPTILNSAPMRYDGVTGEIMEPTPLTQTETCDHQSSMNHD